MTGRCSALCLALLDLPGRERALATANDGANPADQMTICAHPDAAARASSSPYSNGSTGSITVAFASRSETCRPQRRQPHSTRSLRQGRSPRQTRTRWSPACPARFTLAEHTAIVDMIEAKDGDRAATAMEEHLNRSNKLYRHHR